MPDPRRGLRVATLLALALSWRGWAEETDNPGTQVLDWIDAGRRVLSVELAPGELSPAAAPVWNVALARVPPGARVGHLRLHETWIDRRGQPIAPGRYALRYAVQPLSKDHIGTTARRDFLVLIPIADDPVDETIGEAQIWALGRKASQSNHPAILEVREAGALAAGEQALHGSFGGVAIAMIVAAPAIPTREAL